jgi:hypothetical protein
MQVFSRSMLVTAMGVYGKQVNLACLHQPDAPRVIQAQRILALQVERLALLK